MVPNPHCVFSLEKWSLHSFLTTAPHQADVAGSILLFFYKKKRKQNKKSNKILLTTSTCCGAVVRNECKDHFSFLCGFWLRLRMELEWISLLFLSSDKISIYGDNCIVLWNKLLWSPYVYGHYYYLFRSFLSNL
jgi:hypothetical protein